MSWNPNLRIGEELSNEKLVKLFDCGRTGKIRKSAARNGLIVIWNSMIDGERWTNDVLGFRGVREDGQEMNNALNRALCASRKSGVSIYLFEQPKANAYVYYGTAVLADEPRREMCADSEGEQHAEWIFPLRRVENEPVKSHAGLYDNELDYIFSSGDSGEMAAQIDRMEENEARKEEMKQERMKEERLCRRIKAQFGKKKYLGDIDISDEEYQMLLGYMRRRYRAMEARYSFRAPDEVFCVGMVQIGIRCYEDGAYWPKFQQELGVATNGVIQGELGNMFEETLRKGGYSLLKDQRFLNQLLMQGFVCNRYAGRLFEYLYGFYRQELFCDKSNLKGRRNALLQAMARNDRRQVKIVTQTADAIAYNQASAGTRVQGLLNLIDKAYWNEPLPQRENSRRLTRAFLDWQESDGRALMNKDMAYGGQRRGGDKRFSKPMIRYDGRQGTFELVLPPQIVPDEEAADLRWVIVAGGHSDYRECSSVESYTGQRVEGMTLPLDSELLLEKMSFCLMNGECALRRFSIAAASIRFFDEEGIWVNDDKLPAGRAISFSKPDFTPESRARTSIMRVPMGASALLCAEYVFENGDVVCFPDGKPLCVGDGRLQEGLLKRGCVAGVRAQLEDGAVDVYASSPMLYMKIRPEQLSGTKLTVNGCVCRMSEGSGLRTFDPMDRSGEIGCLIELESYGCHESGVYDIRVDVPADRTNRHYRFQLICGLSHEFVDAPYIYKDTGAISVPEECALERTPDIEKENLNGGRKYFIFKLLPGRRWIGLDAQGTRIEFKVPMFEYCFEGDTWRTNGPVDVWRQDFKERLSIHYEADKLSVSMQDDSGEIHERIVERKQEKDVFECDLNEFKSWFTGEQRFYTLYLTLPGAKEQIPFLNVYTRAIVLKAPAALKAEPGSGCVRASFDIISRGSIFADLYRGDELICEKQPLVSNELVLKGDFENGMYCIALFEQADAEDEDGFGEETDYSFIEDYSVELINPGDLRGKSVEIVAVCSRDDQPVSLHMKRICRLYNLRRGKEGYVGDMVIRSKNSDEIRERCEGYLELIDPENLQSAYVGFMEDGEPTQFLYDNERGYIVCQEDQSIPRYKQYIRYSRMLTRDDYSFFIRFIAPSAEEERALEQICAAPDEACPEPEQPSAAPAPAEEADSPEEAAPRLSDETRLRDTALSRRVCDVLAHTKGISTVGELRAYIVAHGMQAIERLRYLRSEDLEELEAFIHTNNLDKTEG